MKQAANVLQKILEFSFYRSIYLSITLPIIFILTNGIHKIQKANLLEKPPKIY